ncbi:Katanin p80 WD40 repeat-containing subunit B1 [Fasciola gigantica]|uniref:Katanin p80 WD40 repeat-containing subunit B1 n=1 Tax=Fasciola gigantica TaxID=46835 RepID=A0A504Y7M8_FASGI|nr:Katanin p80 WD40 repeat-containing subunit B1 [Fasciola gigantica]
MKAWKLQECVAHSPGSVTSLSLGRKSGRVMATGGEDRRVKLWAVGKPTCILSLTGHTSSVEAIEFSQQEDRVAAGSLSGSIRIWDLEQVKNIDLTDVLALYSKLRVGVISIVPNPTVHNMYEYSGLSGFRCHVYLTLSVVRALSGHTSGINSLDFHPVGNFVTSGSVDSLVKVSREIHSSYPSSPYYLQLWDVSRKGCINTYRGHSGGVNMVRFSPDGNWVVSGGEDGLVKLWDLSAGRLLAELPGHTGPVTAVAFHPTVLLLATASADRTVRLFDLENFTQIAMSGTELNASVIRRIAFHPDGVCLYVANMDYLKIYDYESMTCLETVHVGWRTAGGLDDMAIAPSYNQLVGASRSNSLVSTYVVDIKSCVPFSDSGASAREVPRTDVPCSDLAPASATDDVVRRESQEDPTDPDSQLPYKPTAEDQFEMNTVADITDPEEYDRVFKPHRTVPRSPTRLVCVSSTITTVASASPFRGPDPRRPSPPTVLSQPQPQTPPQVCPTQPQVERVRSSEQSVIHVNDKRPLDEVPFSPPEQEHPRRCAPRVVNKPSKFCSNISQLVCPARCLCSSFH